MTDRELDAKCAEILGWTEVKMPVGLDLKPTGHYVGIPPTCGGKVRWDDVSVYSTSLDAARELLEWASQKEKSKWMKMIDGVCDRLGIGEFAGLNTYTGILQCLLATPRQIAEAFVECFGGEK